MIHFNNKEYTEKDVEQARIAAPNIIKRFYAAITRKLDNFDYGLFRDFDDKDKTSVMEILSVAHHCGIKTSTISEGLAGDLASYLRSADLDMSEEDYITLALSEPREDWEDVETPSSDVDSEVINHFEDYLESVYYSPHVQKLLEDQDFKSMLAYLNIDEILNSCCDWLDDFR